MIAKQLENIMNKFCIFNKVNYMAVDNASVMKNTCLKLNKEFVGCLNHLLNLMVKRFFNSKIINSEDINEPSDESEDVEADQNDLFDDIFDEEIDDLDEFEENASYEYDQEQLNALKTVAKILKKVKKVVALFNSSIPLRELLVKRTKLTLINDIKIRWN
jgi:hypothetical protein